MNRFTLLILAALLLTDCGSRNKSSDKIFSFEEDSQGFGLSENGKPVFHYQREPKSGDGNFFYNNYLHPLYSLNGDTLTEEFPPDHLHHRGVFWAWHQIYIGDESAGDGWMMDNFIQDIQQVETKIINKQAVLKTRVFWKSPLYQDARSFLEENTTITVHPTGPGTRTIDFRIALRPLVPGIQIGGSDDAKGYGGFSARLRLPDDLAFTSENGKVMPQTTQVEAGPWMDFSGSFGKNGGISGVTMICLPQTPNYPAPWILRQKNSMQNLVFPGRERVELPYGTTLMLMYRMVIHKGAGKGPDQATS